MSSLPSPFTSPSVTENGPVPVAKVCRAWKVPSPLPKSTLALAEPPFAVMRSSLPSPFTSPSVTERGFTPVAKVCWFWKVPLPLPKSTLALSEFRFAVMRSSLPSPFTSPSVTDLGLVPVAKSVLGRKVPLPLPKSTLAVLIPFPELAVTISSLPSPFTSPSFTENGLEPVAKVCWGEKVAVMALPPVPKSTLALLESLFAMMMSSLPSPFKSPRVTENG